MDGNIYYIGAYPQPISTITSQSYNHPRSRHIHIHPISRERNSNNNKHNNSRSTSSPKTQPTAYAITLQKLRCRSPKTQINTPFNLFNNNQTIKTQNRVLTARYAGKGELSSGINQANMKSVNREKHRGGNLFRKVQQPRFRSKDRQKVTDTINYRVHDGQNIKQNNNKLANIPPIINTQHHIDQSQPSIQLHYKLQPLKKLFLCTRCYQFTPIIQLQSHHLSCRIPLNKQQFINKWHKIIDLLQQIVRQHHNNSQLYRLVDRMEWYMSQCHIGHRQGYILYSQQLECVLSLKSSIVLECVSVDDLFWLIETVGDLIQTKGINLEQTAFWKICT